MLRDDRVGEKRMMNCGMEAEIIVYNNCMDVSVKFEDGTVANGVPYASFRKGTIALDHDDRAKYSEQSKCRLVLLQSASEYSIAAFCSMMKISENSFIIWRRLYRKGKFSRSVVKDAKKYVRQFCKWYPIVYSCLHSCVSENEYCKQNHVSYTQYLYWSSQIKESRFKLKGEMNFNNKYWNVEVYDEQEESVDEIECVTGDNIKVFDRNDVSTTDSKYVAQAKSRIGTTKLMRNGKKATIIRYGGCDDIDVKFEDGTVVKHKAWHNFNDGNIGFRGSKVFSDEAKEKRIGEKRVMNCGLEAEIIAYRSSNDIDVKLQNGIIRTGARYPDFKKGKIGFGTPRGATLEKNKVIRIGEKRVMNCGLEAEIIAYRRFDDIDVRFEDGLVRHGVWYSNFKSCCIGHRLEKSKCTDERECESSSEPLEDADTVKASEVKQDDRSAIEMLSKDNELQQGTELSDNDDKQANYLEVSIGNATVKVYDTTDLTLLKKVVSSLKEITGA